MVIVRIKCKRLYKNVISETSKYKFANTKRQTDPELVQLNRHTLIMEHTLGGEMARHYDGVYKWVG